MERHDPEPGADNAARESLARKVTQRVIPVLFIAWLVAYLNRFNVSFAALQMNGELGLSPTAYGFGSGVFFLAYAIFEIPSNIVLARVGARRWLARIMATVGIVGIAMAWTAGPTSFYVLRFALGTVEAGLFPGMALYLSQWLDPRSRAAAFGLLGSAAMVAGIIGGPLASWALTLDETLGVDGWRWLFVIEGVIALPVAAAMWWCLPERPEAASWLTASERHYLEVQAQVAPSPISRTKALWTVAMDSRYRLWATAFFLASATGASVRLVRPSILRDVANISDTWASMLTAVPGVVGCIAIIYIGRSATKLNERRWHAALPMALAAVGVALMGVTYGLLGALIVSSVASLGAAAQPPLFGAVSSVSNESTVTRGVAIAFVNMFGALGSFAGPYAVGFAIDQGGLAVACAIASLMIVAGSVIVWLPRDSVVRISFENQRPRERQVSV